MTQLGLNMFNEMTDQWQGFRVLVFQTLRSVYTFTGNKASYSIGVGSPDWNGFRPQDIERAGFINTTITPQPTEYPIRIYTDEEWASVGLKTLTDSQVFGIWYQKSMPYGTIFPWPICSSSGMQIALYVPTPILAPVTNDATGLNTDISTPPGGTKAIRLNLALAMSPSLEKEPSPTLIAQAALALDNYAKSFYAQSKLGMPAGIRAQRRRRGYNIITNEGGY